MVSTDTTSELLDDHVGGLPDEIVAVKEKDSPQVRDRRV